MRLQSPIIVKIVRMLYTGTTAAIKHTTTLFQTFTGCRQGGIESPIIFNIYLDFVLRCAEKNREGSSRAISKYRSEILF